MNSVSDLLGAEGPFAQQISTFAPRSAQQTLAQAIMEAVANRSTLVAEAGTGTGKTFAYLVPALLSGKRIIISTGTKTLQDQLFYRDLPRVRNVLKVRMKISLLKGRANYLCLYRLEQTQNDGWRISREEMKQFQVIRQWAQRTTTGDRADLEGVQEDAPVWAKVTSTTDNCLGSDCPMFDDCFVVKARRAAQEADMVVVNHHLLFADLAIKHEGFGEILPGAHAFILDEAHQIPELAGQFFSAHVTARQITELAQDVLAESGGVSGVLATLQPALERISPAVKRLRLALDRLPLKGTRHDLLRDAQVTEEMTTLNEALSTLHQHLEMNKERSRGLANCAERAAELSTRLTQFQSHTTNDYVYWYEITAQGFSFHATPLDLAPALRALRQQTHSAWIYTSATLSVAGRFDHFSRQLGLEDPITLNLTSPFDFSRQALTYLPSGLSDPNDKNYTDGVIEAALPVLEASRGRAFILFTSHRALKRAAELLVDKISFPLFIQGTLPRPQLLEKFRESGSGVLLGAASFWEGVDVAGEALSCVIIDKIPFAAPDDPVLEARLNALREAGGNPFTDWQIPSAVIALKQGVGRLIRDVNDRGVLMLCDPRLTSRSYGKLFLKSLPTMPLTRELKDVQSFFQNVKIKTFTQN